MTLHGVDLMASLISYPEIHRLMKTSAQERAQTVKDLMQSNGKLTDSEFDLIFETTEPTEKVIIIVIRQVGILLSSPSSIGLASKRVSMQYLTEMSTLFLI